MSVLLETKATREELLGSTRTHTYVQLHKQTSIIFKSNTAKAYGGAIYVISRQKEFVQTSEHVDLLVSSFKRSEFTMLLYSRPRSVDLL